jgi:hypothetical protein
MWSSFSWRTIRSTDSLRRVRVSALHVPEAPSAARSYRDSARLRTSTTTRSIPSAGRRGRALDPNDLWKRSPTRHPSFRVPENPDLPLWRYMSGKRFRWLVENERLYMPRIEQLTSNDAREATMPKIFLYAFDLIELNGEDMRRDPLQVRRPRSHLSWPRPALASGSTSISKATAQERVRTFEVRVHFDFCFFAPLGWHHDLRSNCTWGRQHRSARRVIRLPGRRARAPCRYRRDRHPKNLLQRLTCYSFPNRPRCCRRKLAGTVGRDGRGALFALERRFGRSWEGFPAYRRIRARTRAGVNRRRPPVTSRARGKVSVSLRWSRI